MNDTLQKKHENRTLEGYRALDLTDEKGYLCGKILGDLGADVIKVEKPEGDPSRGLGPFYKNTVDPQKSILWFAHNTSKRSITLCGIGVGARHGTSYRQVFLALSPVTYLLLTLYQIGDTLLILLLRISHLSTPRSFWLHNLCKLHLCNALPYLYWVKCFY